MNVNGMTDLSKHKVIKRRKKEDKYCTYYVKYNVILWFSEPSGVSNYYSIDLLTLALMDGVVQTCRHDICIVT